MCANYTKKNSLYLNVTRLDGKGEPSNIFCLQVRGHAFSQSGKRTSFFLYPNQKTSNPSLIKNVPSLKPFMKQKNSFYGFHKIIAK